MYRLFQREKDWRVPKVQPQASLTWVRLVLRSINTTEGEVENGKR